MKKPSLFKKISDKDVNNIKYAIKEDKYWKVSENDKRYYFVIILSRGRTPSFRGRFVRVTGFKTVEADDRIAWFCRKYRVGIVDAKEKILVGVLTWSAFKRLIHNGEKIIELIKSHSLPPYINKETATNIIRY
jgi:hypothetical protein